MPLRLPVFWTHTIFITGFLLFMFAINTVFYDWQVAVLRTILNSVFHLFLIYLTSYVLFPKLFKQKKYFYFFSASLVMLSGFAWLRWYIEIVVLSADMFPVKGMTKYAYEERIGVFVFFSGFGIWLATFNFCLITNWFRRQQRLMRRKTEKLDRELRFLKSQINPHFLFNTLHNLYSLCYLKDDRAAPTVLKLSEMLRYTLYECDTEMIDLEKELKFLGHYIELQRMKTDIPLPVTFSVEGQAANGCKIPPLLLLPLIENGFKHSDLENSQNGYLHVQFILENKLLKATIENTKRSTPNTQRESSGIGLKNVQKRLALLYPDQHTFAIHETPTLFCRLQGYEKQF